MEEMGNTIEELLKAINRTLKDLSACKDINHQKTLAETVKLLCDSLGVFFDAMELSDMGLYDDFEDDDEEYDDDVVDFSSIKKKKNKKKKKDDDIPF